MTNPKNKFRFLLVQPFQIPGNSKHCASREGLPKEKRLMNYDNVRHLLEDVDWLWMKDLLRRMKNRRPKTEKSFGLIF